MSLLTNENNDIPNHDTGMTMHCPYLPTKKATNPTIIRPHIVFTDGRQPRQIQPHYDQMWCLLTDNNDKPNHNTTTYCAYSRTTTTNPTIIRQHVVFTDERQQRQFQPKYDHIVFTNGQKQQQIKP